MASKKNRPALSTEQPADPRTPEQFRLALRRKTRLFYDIQGLRIQVQGRLTKKAPGASIELHPNDLKKIDSRLQDLENAEKNALGDLEEQLNEVPFFTQIIEPRKKEQYRGLGPRMASVIIANIDIHRADTVSKVWKFCGLAPIPATRCKHCSAIVTENGTTDDHETGGMQSVYKHPKPPGNKCAFRGVDDLAAEETFASGKQMRPVAGEKLPYSAWLRTKLCGVLATVMLQVGSPYRKYYDNYKQRKQQANWGTCDAHRHHAALRYMIKMLLLDIWKDWRAFEKLPIRPSYQEEYLNHTTSMKPIVSFDTKGAEVYDPRFMEEQILIQEEVASFAEG